METLPVGVQIKIAEFIRRYHGDQLEELMLGRYEGEPTLALSLSEMGRYDIELSDDLLEYPDEIGSGVETVVDDLREILDEVQDDPDVGDDIKPLPRDLPEDVAVEFTDPPSAAYHDIGAPRGSKHEQLVAFEGICKQVSSPTPRLLETELFCGGCGTPTTLDLRHTFDLDGAIPGYCPHCGDDGNWEENEDERVTEEYQQLIVQEPPEDANSTKPRKIIADALGEHLMDRVEPGNRVTIVGVVREDEDADSTLMKDRVEVSSVVPEETQFEDVELEEEDREKIEELAADENLRDYLANSVAPTLYGYETERLAIALQMFGGVSRTHYGERKRGEIHIANIGDPGTGKSAMLESARRIAPRAVSATGTGATEVGLTATAVKEEIGDEESWTVQAGSLVLADGSLITIDELDNMATENQSALDQALSDGKVEVDKANVHATLNARCSALIAANPREGRFDRYEAYHEQFGFPKELLSRFDLVFAYEDTADEAADAAIAEKMLNPHSAAAAAAVADGGEPVAVDQQGVIDPDLFRKYIAYARRECNPSLSETAQERLSDFYQTIRSRLSSEDQIPIDTRKLAALRRLSQASARARLSDIVEERDAQLAIDLMMESLNQVAKDPDGEGFSMDFATGRTSAPSQKKRLDAVEETIRELQGENPVPHGDVLAKAPDDIDKQDVESAIRKLKRQGDIYQPQSSPPKYRTS